jgi:hypothetical protein
MNLFELANRLGHESVLTTTSTYGHLVPDAHFRAAEMVELALMGPADEELEEDIHGDDRNDEADEDDYGWAIEA